MIRTTLFLLACFFSIQVNVQGWTHIHGLPLQNPLDKAELNSIEKVPGNGYVLSGQLQSQGQPERPLLLRLDEYGNPIQVRSYPVDSAYFHQVIPTSDGGYFGITGKEYNGTGAPLTGLIKLDAAGDSVWSYPLPSPFATPQISEDLIFESPGGGYGLLVFSGDSVFLTVSYPRLILLDSSGSLLMDTTYTSLPSDLLLRSGDGHVVVSGSITDGTRLPLTPKLDSTNSAVANLVSGRVYFDYTNQK